eukprot:1877346-Prorocentrum_lima.AAC.1
MPAISNMDAFNILAWGFIKTVALQHGDLERLWCEGDLAKPPAVPFGTTVDVSILESAKAARKAALKLLALEGEAQAETIIQ